MMQETTPIPPPSSSPSYPSSSLEADIEQTLLARRDERVVDREVQALDGHLIASELHQATDESMAHELSAPERAHDATEGPRQARQHQRSPEPRTTDRVAVIVRQG